MKSTTLLASIGVLVALIGTAPHAYAGDSHRGMDRDVRERHADWGSKTAASGMQPVPTMASPGEPGYGWRYFTDPVAAIAIVISPQGEHFFSRGDGLRLITVGEPTH